MVQNGGREGKGTYRYQEKHVHLLIQILEPARIVRKAIATIGSGGIAKEDTLDLIREFGDHCRIIAHNVAVTRIRDEDEFALGKSAEDLLEQEFADGQGSADVAEVEGPRVEGTTGVGLVDEIHVIAGDLFGGGGEVVEVEVGDAARPVGVDLGHVHPGGEGAGEGV